MTTLRPVLRLTSEFDGFKRQDKVFAFNLFHGDLLHIEGDYADGVNDFLEYLSGIRICKSATKFLHDKDISQFPPEKLHKLDMRYVTGRRKLISCLTFEEHIRLRLTSLPAPVRLAAAKDKIAAWLPILQDLFSATCANLSGGQQQLAMLGLAAVGSPRVVVIDEPFMGIAQEARKSVETMFSELRQNGTVLVVSEQQRSMANLEKAHIVCFRKSPN